MNINKAFSELAQWCKDHKVKIGSMDGMVSFAFMDKSGKPDYKTDFFYSHGFDEYTKTVKQWDTVAIGGDDDR